MKGCRKEFYWKDENGVYLWTNCGNKHKNDFSNRTESMLCPECSKSKSELDKSVGRETSKGERSASGLTPKEKAFESLPLSERNDAITKAIDIAIQEQRKKEREFLKDIQEKCGAQLREIVKERIKQLEAKQ